MIAHQWPIALAALLCAAGLWLLLPRGAGRGRRLGAVVCGLGLGLLALIVHGGAMLYSRPPYLAYPERGPRLGGGAEDFLFLALAGVTVGSAVASVTFRNPVYCAIWFALTLTGTAGLYLYQGAQFLGAATIVVYAGAILVTFLFVLMLAQPEGHAYYDRITWEPMLASCVGAVMVGMLTIATSSAFPTSADLAEKIHPLSREINDLRTDGTKPEHVKRDETILLERRIAAYEKTFAERSAAAQSQASEARDQDILAPNHMARLGGELFSRQLIAVEVAGTLLLVALVGAVAIVGLVGRPGERTASASGGENR